MTELKRFNARFGFTIENKGESSHPIHQVHGKEWLEIRNEEYHEELLCAPVPADAVWTKASNLEISVGTADCLPLLFLGSEAIAAVHCGWRGALLGIAGEWRKIALGQNIQVVLGPCLLPCCFEVKEDFVKQFRKSPWDFETYLTTTDHRLFFDLPGFVVGNFLQGIDPHNLHNHHLSCTYCDRQLWPSYRRNGSTDTRIRAWAMRD